ncbi:MAG: cbb3-type cytochrome c oxidase subunit I, partial [Actinomycetota bacterium]|nr:cbb3-type cytochrome c oxidase subunit I [Actinomycetota bacterium]
VWTGQVEVVYGPGPDWLETVAIVFTVGLLVPILAVVANLAATMQGKWDLLRSSMAIRFSVLGGLSYLLVGVMGALGATRSASAVVDFTSWEEATLHLTLFGLLTSWLAAFIYHAWPRLIGRDWFKPSLAERHFRLTAGGLTLLALALWAGGLVSGYSWAGGAATAAFANAGEGFRASLSSLGLFRLLAVLGMLGVAAGQALFVFHMYRTYTSGPAVAQELLVPVPPSSSTQPSSEEEEAVG